MRLLNTLKAIIFFFKYVKIFKNRAVLKEKRIVVIGAADSAFTEKNGDYINNFDFIIRVNKAPHTLNEEKTPFIGSRTDILFHSFYENNESGGGPINFGLYDKQKVKYLINPNNNKNGKRAHLNYFKRNFYKRTTYLLPDKFYRQMTSNFKQWTPTIGYSALYTALNSGCSEVYITGFTFFKTPYANDYRDHFKDMEVNNQFIEKQAIHNPDLELIEFIREYDSAKRRNLNVILDPALQNIVDNYRQFDEKRN